MQGDNLERLTIEKAAKEKKPRVRRRMSSLFFIAAALVLVAAVAYHSLSKGREVQVARVGEVYPSQMLSRLNASGYVVAQRKADVASKITGQMVAIWVQEGSIVKEGQLIAQLENEDAKANLEQGRANLTLARARLDQARADLENVSLDFERKKALVASGAVSRSEFDAAEARYLGAKAALDASRAEVESSAASLSNAQIALSYSEIRAPFDAVVLTKNADVGDIITPFGAAANAKAAVVSIADLSSLQVEVDVSEANISSVSVGQPCDILLDAMPEKRFPGVVDTIVPTVDRSKATVLVKVRFKEQDARILPEMSAKVGFLSRELTRDELRPRTMVAASAVQRSGDNAHVFVVKGGRVSRVEVVLGASFKDMFEVLGGLKPGDTVVVEPPKGLRDGSKIVIPQQ
ncbi:MAG TPA: efflux RND transporter periplasmic adaptor subunit [Deltaproteobacteria bacterium]|nr:efflux RND transporter periplasmic adaptor subunit [Deltaproteobacteria bacterium]HQI82332.1 efflux RND transporter periplasmic adaptor subunit [Deltaproteobacteria bacterium]